MSARLLDHRTRAEVIRLEDHARRSEDAVFARRVHALATEIHRGVPAIEVGPAFAFEQRAAAIAHLAARRLRQLGEDVA